MVTRAESKHTKTSRTCSSRAVSSLFPNGLLVAGSDADGTGEGDGRVPNGGWVMVAEALLEEVGKVIVSPLPAIISASVREKDFFDANMSRQVLVVIH